MIEFTIPLTPVSKKNSQRIVNAGGQIHTASLESICGL